MNYKIFLLTALLATLLSCSKEGGRSTSGPEREVEMDFMLPGALTRATDEENDIKNLTLLVFNGPADNSTYLYSRYAWKKSGAANTYSTTLKIGTGFTIYFAVNAGTLPGDLQEEGIVEGQSTWADVREKLVTGSPENINLLQKGLPMWGMVTNQTIADQAGNHLGTIQLIRSVASIDIYMLDADFELEKGYAVFAANKGYIPYDPGKMDLISGVWRANAPYCPPGFNTLVDLEYTLTEQDNNDILNKLYVWDNSTSLNPASGPNRPTKVVLQGIWKDGDGESSFYPLSIRDKIAENTYVKKQVTRNNKYTIMIREVHGDGFEDLEQAKDADDVNWDYDVIEWDDNEDGEIIIDGRKYFFRDRSTVTLPRSAGSTDRVNIRTNYDLSDIKMKFSGDSQYTEGGVMNHHPRFKVEIVEGVSAGSSYDFIRVTAKKDYGTDDNPATVNFTVGRISFNIKIEQADASPDDWNDGGGIGIGLG